MRCIASTFAPPSCLTPGSSWWDRLSISHWHWKSCFLIFFFLRSDMHVSRFFLRFVMYLLFVCCDLSFRFLFLVWSNAYCEHFSEIAPFFSSIFVRSDIHFSHSFLRFFMHLLFVGWDYSSMSGAIGFSVTFSEIGHLFFCEIGHPFFFLIFFKVGFHFPLFCIAGDPFPRLLRSDVSSI